MRAYLIIAGVMAFLWSASVLATGLATIVSEGRLTRRQWRLVAIAAGLQALFGIAYPYAAPPAPPASRTPSPR